MKIEVKEIKKKPNADVYILNKKTGLMTDPLIENGGGIVDIIVIALRIITLHVHDPFIDGPIILDEPSKMVSKEYIPLLSEFLKNISRDFGRQIILITHNDFLGQIADKKFHVRLGDDDTSIVE
jgi:DNA repair ATPase RecN